MRVREIAPAAVDIDGQAEVPLRHRRTLEVPAGPAASERARPRRGVRSSGDGTPQREVERRAAFRRIEGRVVLRRVDPAHLRGAHVADGTEAREGRDVEVKAAAGRPVGVAAGLEPLGEAEHRHDLARRVRHDVGPAPAEHAHVGEEAPLLAAPERAPVDVVARRALQDRLVDVRDVLRVLHAQPTRLEQARDEVEGEERTGVTEVRRVIRCHAADVHRDLGRTGAERHDHAATRVVEGQHLA